MFTDEIQLKVPRTRQVEQCTICDCRDSTFFFSAPDRLHGIPGEFNYHLCSSCKTVFQNPAVVQDDLALCYPQTYYTHESGESAAESVSIPELLSSPPAGFKNKIRNSIISSIRGESDDGIVAALGSLLSKFRGVRERAFCGLVMDELLPRSSEQIKALEIGCGGGYLLRNLKLAGWQTEGIEWDERAAEAAAKNSGSPVFTGDVTALNLEAESYSLIVLHHVFEHLTQPVETLREIHRLLKPGGRVVLVYPNPRSLNTKIYESCWYHWDPPRHLVFPSFASMRGLAGKLGFGLTGRTTSRYAAEGSAQSRQYKKNLQASRSIEIGSWDMLAKSLQTVLIWLGFNIGEEIILVLKKRQS